MNCLTSRELTGDSATEKIARKTRRDSRDKGTAMSMTRDTCIHDKDAHPSSIDEVIKPM